jgi:hypothetical protein
MPVLPNHLRKERSDFTVWLVTKRRNKLWDNLMARMHEGTERLISAAFPKTLKMFSNQSHIDVILPAIPAVAKANFIRPKPRPDGDVVGRRPHRRRRIVEISQIEADGRQAGDFRRPESRNRQPERI